MLFSVLLFVNKVLLPCVADKCHSVCENVCSTLHGRISDVLNIIKLTVCALFISFVSHVPSPENENNMAYKNLESGTKDSTLEENNKTQT